MRCNWLIVEGIVLGFDSMTVIRQLNCVSMDHIETVFVYRLDAEMEIIFF